MPSPSRPSWAHPGRARVSGVHAAVAGRQRETPPPVLASEVLREDLAPTEPGRLASRFWSGSAALALVAVGIALRFDLGTGGGALGPGTICLAVAAAEAATALVPLPYLWRAMAGAAVCLAAVCLGLVGIGPLALLAPAGVSTPWTELSRVVAAVVLPAAILFRSHYRAYERGRLLLALAVALAIPFLAHEAIHFVDASRPLEQIGPGLAIAIVLLMVVAFMGAPTTATTIFCAVALGFSIGLDVFFRQAYLPPPPGSGPAAHALTAVAFVACTSPIAMGMFQLLATIYGPDARQVDVRQPTPEARPPGSLPPDSVGRP
jgi:hypothetical protein